MQVTTSISDHVMIHGVRCRQIRPVSIPRQMPRWLATIAGCAAQKKAKHPSQRTRSWTQQKPVGQSFRIMGPTWSPDTGAFYRMDYVFRRSCQTLSFYDSILKQTKVIGVVYTSIESLPGSSSLVWTPKHHQKQTVWGWHFTLTYGGCRYNFCCAFCCFFCFIEHSHGLQQLGCRYCLKHSVSVRSPSEETLKAQCKGCIPTMRKTTLNHGSWGCFCYYLFFAFKFVKKLREQLKNNFGIFLGLPPHAFFVELFQNECVVK